MFIQKRKINKKRKIVFFSELWLGHPLTDCFDSKETFYVSFYNIKYKKYKSISNERIIKFQEKKRRFKLNVIIRIFKIFFLINKLNPEFIIAHHDDAIISILPTLIFYKILKKNNKFVAYIHRPAIDFEEKTKYVKFMSFFMKNFYIFFDKIITVSYGNEKYLKEKFNFKNIEVIYNPIDIKKNEKLSIEKVEYKFENNKFYFVNVGRLSLQKNQEQLIRTFKKLSEKYKNVKLIMLGGGELKDYLLNLIVNLNLIDKVDLLGNQENIFKYLKKSNCFVLSSNSESFGQVIVEALSLNLPVISSDCKYGPREILEPNIDINKKIKYPFDAKYGVLYNNKCNNNINIELYKVMEKFIIDSEYLNKYKKGKLRAIDFEMKNIKDQIKNVLNNIE